MHANRKLTEEHKQEIVEHVRNGVDYADIARGYRVSRTRIYQLAKAAGVHVPKRVRRAPGVQG